MQDVPKIVLKRLPGMASAEAHPDANVLTAFAEQGLAEVERAPVMRHLAQCQDCREAVALALPASEDVAGTTRQARIGWVSWPVLRWGAVAAGILVVTSIGVVQYRQRQTKIDSPMAKAQVVEELPRIGAATRESAVQPSTPDSRVVVPKKQLGGKAEERKLKLESPSAATADQRALIGGLDASQQIQRPVGGGIGGPVGTGSAAGSGSDASMASPVGKAPAARKSVAAPAPENATAAAARMSGQQNFPRNVPAQSYTTVGVTGAASAAPAVSANEVAQIEAPKDLSSQARNTTDLDVVKAKEPEGQAAAKANSLLTGRAASVALARAPRWGIGANGALQRSFDTGKTWEDVNVSQEYFYSFNGMQSEQSRARLKKDANDAKAQPSSGLVFRAVAAIDHEVWAGGSGAVLFHSVDFGSHWAKVLPSDASVALTGDIVSIDFSDLQRGRVATSTGEVWTTANSGQTWHKQP